MLGGHEGRLGLLGSAGQCWAHLQPQGRIEPRESQHAGVVLLLLSSVQAAQDLISQPGLGILQHLQTRGISTEVGCHNKTENIVRGQHCCEDPAGDLVSSSYDRLTGPKSKLEVEESSCHSTTRQVDAKSHTEKNSLQPVLCMGKVRKTCHRVPTALCSCSWWLSSSSVAMLNCFSSCRYLLTCSAAASKSPDASAALRVQQTPQEASPHISATSEERSLESCCMQAGIAGLWQPCACRGQCIQAWP